MKKTIFAFCVAAFFVLAGCAQYQETRSDDAPIDGAPVVVGSAMHIGNVALSHVVMQALSANDIPYIDNTLTGSTLGSREAMLDGEIDVLWSYTAATWSSFMGNEPVPGDTVEDVHSRIREADMENGIYWLNPAPAAFSSSLMMRRELAERLGIRTLTDVAEYLNNGGTLRFVGTPSSIERRDGLAGLRYAYGMDFGSNVMPLVADMIFPALVNGHADISTAFVTDWRMTEYDFVVLEDDLGFYAPNGTAPLVRAPVLERFPQLDDILNPISESLTLEDIRSILYNIDHGMEPGEAALQWLTAEGFLEQ